MIGRLCLIYMVVDVEFYGVLILGFVVEVVDSVIFLKFLYGKLSQGIGIGNCIESGKKGEHCEFLLQ